MTSVKKRLIVSALAGFLPLAGLCLIFFFHGCSDQSVLTHSNKNYNKVIDSVNHLVNTHQDDRSIKYLDSATSNFKFDNLGILQRFTYYTTKYNYYLNLKSDNNRAVLLTDSMLVLFDNQAAKLKYISQYDLVFFLRGDALFRQGKYDEAYQYFYRGKLIANKDINDCAISDFSYHMGMILYKQENYRLAALNFINGTKEKANCEFYFGNFYRIQELLNNTGLCYSKLNQADSALFFYKKALKYINEYAGKFEEHKERLDVARGVIYGNEAKIYIGQNNLSAAKKLLKQSIGINLRKGNDIGDAELSEIKLARIYYKEKNIDSLIVLLNVMRPQLDSVKNPNAAVDWTYLFARYYAETRNYKAGVSYFLKYDALKDSLAQVNTMLKEADISGQIKRFEKDSEFLALKKDNVLQNLYLRLGAVFGVLILVILTLILMNWKKSRKNMRALGRLNQQVNDQNFSLEHALTDLKQSSQEKDRILRTVAHDLRNPIGGIASITMAMADEEYTDEQREMIDLINDSSKNSLELINEILEVTNNGSTVLNLEMVDINTLINNSVELLRFKAAEKRQKITLELLEAPIELFISREKIWRVAGNLISNAIKFSPVNSEIVVKIANSGKAIEISVMDSGIGIPENLKDKVFNMFTEAKRPGTSGEKSFGLGLSISKQIVESHNGKIWFESPSTGGTCFFMRLPKP